MPLIIFALNCPVSKNEENVSNVTYTDHDFSIDIR